MPALEPPSEALVAQPGQLLRWRVWGWLGLMAWLALVTWRLGSVPGMSMDEAWSILSARGEWPPDNPLSGMTAYSGPFPVLLLDAFGTDAGLYILRGASLLANTALLLVLAQLLRRACPRGGVAGWALPLLATCPVWLVTLRTGIEVTMFTPLLGVLGLYLLVVGGTAATFAGGLCWGLLAYNHLIGVAFPAAVLLAWLFVYRRLPALPFVPLGLGLALGAAPRLLAIALYHERALTGYAASYKLWDAIKDLIWLPKALWETYHGSTAYLRYVGRLAVPVVPYGLLGLGFLLPWRNAWRAVPRQAWFALLVGLGTAVFSTVGAPYIAVRFLTLPMLGLGMFQVLLGAAAIERDPRAGRLVRGTALLLAACNLFYVLADFHLPWERNELEVSSFFLGARSKRTASWAYLPKDELVPALLALSPAPRQVLTSASIERPLRVLLHGTPLSVRPPTEAEPGATSVFVDFDRPPLVDPVCVTTPGGQRCFVAPHALAKYFVVYDEAPSAPGAPGTPLAPPPADGSALPLQR